MKYAFEQMNMNTVFADAVRKNTRSQHVLEKVGFIKFTKITHLHIIDAIRRFGPCRIGQLISTDNIVAQIHYERNKIYILLRSLSSSIDQSKSKTYSFYSNL